MIGAFSAFSIWTYLVSLVVEAQRTVHTSGKSIYPPTIEKIELSAYLGRWYQMYASLIPNQTFEKYGYCVTADYFPLPLAKVAFGLNNSENLESPQGKLQIGSGVSFQTGDPGKYNIVIGTGTETAPTPGPYWIVAVGQIPENQSLYPWSIVSSPYETSLFILARNVSDFRNTYQEAVLNLAEQLGFRFFFNKPLETYQGDDCNYYTPEIHAPTTCFRTRRFF